MVYCDSIVENDSLFLENLTTNTSTSWSSWGGGYAIYSIPYSKKLIKDHIYYFRCTYKFRTSNQKPTWCKIYIQGGMNATTAGVSNSSGLTAGTEYKLSGYGIIQKGTHYQISADNINEISYSLSNGYIYNGEDNARDGVEGSVKDMVVYDVTNLKMALLSSGQISNSNDELVAWCDEHLEYKNKGVLYDITSLVNDSSKININTGIIHCSPVECDGMEVYTVSKRTDTASTDNLIKNTYFDTESGITTYKYNSPNGTVTHERIDGKSQNSPFYPEHKYILKITSTDAANSNAHIGFCAEHKAAANKIFIERFVAKIPVGYTVAAAYNLQGTGSSVRFITSQAGTGDWAEYAVLYNCGSSGSFSTGGHIYLIANEGYTSNTVTWYLAYINNCDITGKSELAYYTALNNKDVIKGNKIYSREFNTVNLLPNGDGSDTTVTLPSGWRWDTSDIAGNAKSSIVQPKNAGIGTFGGKIKINPNCRYKLSMWIKCKTDMTSFLVAIHPYVLKKDKNGNDIWKQLTSPEVVYKPNTKTVLTTALVSGANKMIVKNNANWADVHYGRVGFRNNRYTSSYNELGFSHSTSDNDEYYEGFINGVSGSNEVLFKKEYTGPTIPVNTVVVESISGGWYPYPITKSNLPSDNTWKYVEGYFGKEGVSWDGVSKNASWDAIPFDTTHITLALNIYTNDSSEAIKYADIKIEELGTLDGERHLNTVQFKKFN